MSAPTPDLARIRVWQRFHVAITSLYALPIFAVVSVICGYFYVRGVDIEMRALHARVNGISTALAGTLDPALVDGEPSEERAAPVRDVFAKVGGHDPDIASIYVVRRTPDPEQMQFLVDWVADDEPATPGELYEVEQAPLMAEAFEHGPQVEPEIFADEWGPSLSGYAPIVRNGAAIAVVGVDLAGHRVDEVKRTVLLTTLALYAAALVVLLALAQVVAWSIREPLVKIIATTQAITSGQLSARAALQRRDEFGLLGKHFDGMAAGLEEREFIRETFGRYVSKRLAKRLLGDPTSTQLGGEVLEVTVLVSDLRSYSTISERLSPAQVVTMLNEYMGEMGALVEEHGGLLVEFLGDGILVVFGAPEHDPAHAANAVRCALAMHARLAVLNERWEASGLAALWQQAGVDRLRARVGIHTGEVIAGNMGAFRRMKYAITGEAVTVATRAESLNNTTGTEVLLTRATRDALPEELKARAESVGTHALKGVAAPIEMFTMRRP